MDDFQFKLFRAVQLTAALLVHLIILFGLGPWNTARTVGLLIALPSLVLLFIARFQLGRSFTVTAQAKILVTHGLYSKIRNPMYTFAWLLTLGFLIALQKPYLFVLLPVLLLVQITRVHQEARVLEEKFRDQYREYRKKTWF